MSARGAVLLTLARDVVVTASRRRTLWYFLLASTAVVGALVLGTDVSIVVTRAEAPGPLPRTVTLGHALVPGSVVVQAGDLTLDDPGDGRLVLAGQAEPQGSIDHARGAVTVAPAGVARVDSLVLTGAAPLVGLSAAGRARLLDEGTTTRLAIFGQAGPEGAILRPRLAAPYLLTTFLFGWLLLWIVGSFFGVALGVFATADAVSSALEPGHAELLLSRPVHRVDVVAGRFLGALAFALLQAGWLVGLAVALVGLKLGVWVAAPLAALPVLLLQFAVLLAIATCAGVLTRVHALGLAAAAVAWLVSFGLKHAGAPEGPLAAGLEAVRRVAPPVTQLDAVTTWTLNALHDANGPEDLTARGAAAIVGVALAWVLGPLAVTAWVVARRDC